MTDIKNINYQPNMDEIKDYIDNPVFQIFADWLENEFKALCKIEYSKDVWAMGWNVKFRKAGRGLCVIYPKEKYFTVLVVVGRKEKEQAENMMPELSEEMQAIYRGTKDGNGQRWLMVDIHSENQLYEDVKKLISIRREAAKNTVSDKKGRDKI